MYSASSSTSQNESSPPSQTDARPSHDIVIYLPQSLNYQDFSTVRCDIIPVPRIKGIRLFVPDKFIGYGI